MKIKEQVARKFLVSLGFLTADECPSKALVKKLNGLMEGQDSLKEPTSDLHKMVLTEVLETLSNGEEITLDDEDEEVVEGAEHTNGEEAPKKKKERKPKVEKAEKKKPGRPGKPRLEVPKIERHRAEFRETAPPKLLVPTKQLTEEFQAMKIFPKDRPVQEARLNYHREAIESGEFRGPEWVSVTVEENNETYRINGKHTSTVMLEFFEKGKKDWDGIKVLLRRYSCKTMEDAAHLFSTFDAKQSARSKADVLRAFSTADSRLNDLEGRLLGVVTAAVAYALHGRAYRRLNSNDQATLLLQNADFAEWLLPILKGIVGDQRYFVRSPVIAAMINAYRISPEEAAEFWSEVRDGGEGGKDAPTKRLHTFLRGAKLGAGQGERVGDDEMYTKAIQAWNAWREDSESVKFTYNSNKELPVAV